MKEKPKHQEVSQVLATNFLDLTKLIRSIQRTEGNPDCFGRAEDYCDRLDCAWRQYCLEKSQDETTAYKNEQNIVHNHKSGAKNQLPR